MGTIDIQSTIESDDLGGFLSRMHDDDVTRRIKSDPILMRYGTSMIAVKNGEGFNDFSQRLRAASRLLGSLRTVFENPSLTLLDAMAAWHWDKWHTALLTFKSDHSLLIRIGHALQSIFPFAKGRLLRLGQPTDNLTAFEQLYR